MNRFAAVVLILGLIPGLILGLLTAAAPAGAQSEAAIRPEAPAMSVTGSGEAQVAPDQATVRLGVTAEAPAARQAQQAVNRTAAAVIEAVRKTGVPAERITTAELNVSPTYAPAPPDEQQGPQIRGYQATNVVTVVIDHLEQVGPLIDAGLGAGANRVDGVSFGLRDDGAARAQALTAAAAAARRKAEVLAAALRLRLVELIAVEEQGVAPVVPRAMEMRAMAAVGGIGTPVSPGQISIRAEVILRYRVASCTGREPCVGGPR